MPQVYSGNFLKSLKPKAERQYQKFKDRFDIEKVRGAQTLGNLAHKSSIQYLYTVKILHTYSNRKNTIYTLQQ
jgi:hypothetical protein